MMRSRTPAASASVAGCTPAAYESPTGRPDVTRTAVAPPVPQRIDAELLIPGRGAPQQAASVVLEGRSITYVGPTAGAPQVAATSRVPVVLPGMWECHGHLIGLRAANLEEVVRVPPVLAAARATKDAEAALQAGFTSIRE